MHVGVLLQITAEDGTPEEIQEVVAFEKQTQRSEQIGLSLAEGKAMLAEVQVPLVRAKVASWVEPHRSCDVCGTRRKSKGSYPLLFRTFYGDVPLQSPRLHRYPCKTEIAPAKSSPLPELSPDHVAQEKLYLESRWASLVPYAATAGLLGDVSPIASGANASALRQQTLRVAGRVELELGEERTSFIDGCPGKWASLPVPEGRIVVGLDGGYARDWKDRKTNFELIVGRTMPEDRESRYIGTVHGYDGKSKRRLFDLLNTQCLQANQSVTFLTDGGEEGRSLTELITPEAEHGLDWFQIAMRITVLEQYAHSVGKHDEAEGKKLLQQLERIKWLLWHGNQHRARQETSNFREEVAFLELNYQHLKPLPQQCTRVFAVYINNNSGSIINYGERCRSGERISSAMAESTVNALVSKGFAKRQQMQWTKRGAHLLLQTRTRTLDGTLRPLFERWYPSLAVPIAIEPDQAVAA